MIFKWEDHAWEMHCVRLMFSVLTVVKYPTTLILLRREGAEKRIRFFVFWFERAREHTMAGRGKGKMDVWCM